MMKPTHEMYQDIEMSSQVISASPVQLIQLLFDKVLQQTEVLKYAVEQHDIKQKHRAVNQITKIIQYLRDCLNVDNPETNHVAGSFDKFYAMLEAKLFAISLSNDAAPVDAFHHLIQQVAAAWSTLQHGQPG